MICKTHWIAPFRMVKIKTRRGALESEAWRVADVKKAAQRRLLRF